jgi:thioredoxin-dependent peroxiredoxin
VGSPELPTLDVAFFEASVDAPETNQRLAELLDLAHPVLSDPEKSVARAYGVLAGGRRTALRWTFYIGIDGRIVFIDKAVIADGHGEEVPARLKTLGLARRRPAQRES